MLFFLYEGGFRVYFGQKCTIKGQSVSNCEKRYTLRYFIVFRVCVS